MTFKEEWQLEMINKNLWVGEIIWWSVIDEAHSGQLSTVTYVEVKEQVDQNIEDN
jgi:hypothetical protein